MDATTDQVSLSKAKKARHQFGNLHVAYPPRPTLGLLARKTLLPKARPIPGLSKEAKKALDRRRQTTLTSLVH